MKSWKYRILLGITALLPLLLVALLWTQLPEQTPIHWNLDGSINYGGRRTLWGLAALTPLLVLLMVLLPKVDPRKQNYRKFGDSYGLFCLFFAVFMDAVMVMTLIESLRPGTLDVHRFAQILLALLLLFVGNMMPKFRQNYFCGIKNAWTYASERVWTQTHRLGGKLFFAAGLANLAGAFLPAYWGFAVLLASVMAAVLISTAMSYVWFQREQRSAPQ